MIQDLTGHTGFANEAQLLLVNEASLQDLNDRLASSGAADSLQSVSVVRFRPNLLIGGSSPFCEDSWESLNIGNISLQAAGKLSSCAFFLV